VEKNMAENTRLVDNCGIEVAAVPVDTTGAAVSGDYYSLKNYNHITFIICQGAWAGGTPAVTLKQATAVAGTGEKALSFTKYWSKVAITGTTFTETTVSSDTFNLTATANTVTVIEVDAATLDVSGGFDCVRVNIASPGSNADLIAVVAILGGPRFAQAVLPDAKVD
jgi:hypothetical protein